MENSFQHPNVKTLSDQELIEQTDGLVQSERQTTVQILRHLREIEIRRLFVDLGFSSMYEYCLRRLKYSEGQAQRRLSSARLMTELPQIEERIAAGDLNLTNLSKVQSFVRAERTANHSLSKEDKLELLAQVENKSTREVEMELIKISHQPALLAEKFQITSAALVSTCSSSQDVPAVFTKFETLLDSAQQGLLRDFKNLYAHELPDGSNHSVLMYLLEKAVQHKKKKLGLSTSKAQAEQESSKAFNAPLPSPPPVATRRSIKVSIKKKLWQRAGACCEYRDFKTSQRCSSTFALEVDHLRPVALGGSDNIENLRLLCQAHNSRRSIKTFGVFRGV